MRDYIEIGATPCDEDCAQVGSDNFRERATAESNAYRRQLIRMFGEPPEGASLRVKWFQHDYGSYPEVVCYYEFDDQSDDESKSAEYAFKLEGNAPREWDGEARKELGLK